MRDGNATTIATTDVATASGNVEAPANVGDDDMQVDQGTASEGEESILPPAQKRAVDQAFQELFGYQWGTRFRLPQGSSFGTADKGSDALSCTPHQLRVLVQIFGAARAARILQAGERIVIPHQIRRPKSTLAARSAAQSPANPQRQPAPTTETRSSHQQQQFETKLFAGKPVQVAARSTVPTKKTTTKTSATAGGLDAALQQLAGPSKISTVAKTSADWDQFKTETGLEAELEKKAQGKDAFLVKQDFLTRVDNRKFELEKDERDRERAKEGRSYLQATRTSQQRTWVSESEKMVVRDPNTTLGAITRFYVE